MFDLPKLDDGLACWEHRPLVRRRPRKDVNSSARQRRLGRSSTRSITSRYVLGFVPHGRRGATAGRRSVAASRPRATIAARRAPTPGVADLVPRMLRGCAHGDLHGRNILVGIVRDRRCGRPSSTTRTWARQPVGWDFVKLETELKVRAYPDVFGGTPTRAFIEDVQRFEIDLDRRTEHCHRTPWPEVGSAAARGAAAARSC